MKYIVSFLFMFSSLIANEYYAKIEPINTYNIKSSVSGKVIYTNSALEATLAVNKVVVKIDDKINNIELRQTKNKQSNLSQILKIHKQTLQRFNRVSSKSKFDKDKQKIVILNTKVTLNDLSIKIASLQDMIKNKNVKAKNLYIDKIYVEIGDFVNPGTLLFTGFDLSKGKLDIFVSKDELKDIRKKEILINDKKSNIKINKVYKTTDSKHLSSYKVELLLPKVEQFSKLVKITLK